MTNAEGHTPQPGPPPSGPPTTGSSASTVSTVVQMLLGVGAIGLLLLAVPAGLFAVGMLTMASDSCGSQNTCNKAASSAMLALTGGGPVLVAIVVGIMAIIRATRQRSAGMSVVALLWCGVLADAVCLVAGYIAATAIDPS